MSMLQCTHRHREMGARMIVRHGYVDTETEAAGCPFCGGDDVCMSVAGRMSLHKFYCNDCKVEFTLSEQHVDEERHEVTGLTVAEALERWNSRTDSNEDECPFCGGAIEEWPWGQYLFDSLSCPTGKKRFQFQSHPHSKNSMRRTLREFGKRADGKVVDKLAM